MSDRDEHDAKAAELLPCVWASEMHPTVNSCDSCYACKARPAVAADRREQAEEIKRLKNALACDACDGSGVAISGPCGCRGSGLPEMLCSVRCELVRQAEAHKAEVERLRAEHLRHWDRQNEIIVEQQQQVADAHTIYDAALQEIADLRAKLAECERELRLARGTNWTLWESLTPEKRHELNLDEPRFSIAKAEGK